MREYKQEYAAPQTVQPSDSLAKGAIIADVLVTVIVIAGMAYDSHSVTISVLSGVTFFLLFGALVILTLSGALPAMVINGQNQKTTRQLHRLQYTAQMEQAQRVEVVRHPQIEYTQPTEPMQLPTSPNFVPATPPADARLKLSCVEFVTALFDDNGTPNPRRILGEHTRRPGQIQASKPKPEVVEYLTALYMTWTEEDGMLFFATHYYPTLHDAIAAIKRGTPAGVGGTPPIENPYPSPHYTGEGGVQ